MLARRFLLYPSALLSAVMMGDSALAEAPAATAARQGTVALVRPGALTLPQALTYARAHQPTILAARARVQAARADARVPAAQWLPFVAAGAELLGASSNNTTASYVAMAGLDLPRIGGTPVTASGKLAPLASSLVALGAQQELFDFGRIAAQTAVQDALVDEEKLDADAQWLAIAFGVEESYFAVRAARAVIEASQQAYERARVHRDMAKAKVDAGLSPPIDLTRAAADLTRFDVGRIRAEGGLRAAQAAFAAAVGAPDMMLDAAGEPEETPALPSLSQALELAAQRDPTLREALARMQTQSAVTRAIDASSRPNLSLTAALSGREGGAKPSSGPSARFEGFVPDVPNWDLGILLRWPLYDAVLRARSDASLAREKVRSEEVEVVRRVQVASVQQAYIATEVASAALVALERAVDAARQNYDQADARFRGGLGTIVELTDAEAVRVTADIELALGRFELARARATLGRAMAEDL